MPSQLSMSDVRSASNASADAGSRPVSGLMLASSVDAFGCTLVLTLVAIEVVGTGGLAAAALLANGQMLGYGLGAVATGPLTRRWWLRRILAGSLAASILTRVVVLLCLALGTPLAVTIGAAGLFEFAKAVSITATQSEVVVRRPGGVVLSWSAASLSIGMGLGGALAGVGWDIPVVAVAVASAVPLAVLSRGVTRRAAARAKRLAHLQVVKGAIRPLLLGATVTALAFGPVVLNVGLVNEAAGPGWVAASLLVFHASGLLAPVVSARVIGHTTRTRTAPSAALLPIVAAAVWASWAAVPLGPVFLLGAQLVSGLALHVYGALHAELLIRSCDLDDAPMILGVRALAWQLSAALSSALVPLVVGEHGISVTGLGHVASLVAVAGLVAGRRRIRRILPVRLAA